MAPPLVSAARRAPRRPLSTWFTPSRCRCAPRRPKRGANPSERAATTSSNLSRGKSRYGYALTHVSNRSSSAQSSAAQAATICWPSTSSGHWGMVSVSRLPRRTARQSAAHSTSSSRVSGNRMPLGVPPTVWPERPTRCSSSPMERGEPIWQTWSTTPMSMPSSSDAVATQTLTSPFFSFSSAASRVARERLP